MPEITVEMFIDACTQVVKANQDFVPPYGYNNDMHIFFSESLVGPITTNLYNLLHGIQFRDLTPPKDWIFKVI